MIHDLLLALIGFSGDCFSIDYDNSKFEISRRLKLEKFEEYILREILDKVGIRYVLIRDWVERVSGGGGGSTSECMHAFSRAVRIHVLENFEDDIEILEKRLLDNVIDTIDKRPIGSISLTFLKTETVDKWGEIFSFICDVIEWFSDTTSRDTEQQHVLDYMHREAVGIDSCSDNVVKVWNDMVEFFYREVEAWIMFGTIINGDEGGLIRLVTSEHQDQVVSEYVLGRYPRQLISSECANSILFCGRLMNTMMDGSWRREILSGESPSWKVDPIAIEFFDNRQKMICRTDFYDFMEARVKRQKRELSKSVLNRLRLQISPNLNEHFEFCRGFFLMGYGVLWTRWGREIVDLLLEEEVGSFVPNYRDIMSIKEGEGEGLRFDFSPVWPMELIMRESSVEKYKQMHAFLFPIRNTIFKLGEVRLGNVAGESAMVSCLLSHLNLMLSSFFAFVQTDVVEVHFRDLKAVIRSVDDDLEVIVNAHEKFVTVMYTESLIGIETVTVMIKEVLAIAEQFMNTCRIAEVRGSWTDSELEMRIVGLDQRFQKVMQALMVELESMRKRTIFRTVDRLLLRLDFNKFFNSPRIMGL